MQIVDPSAQPSAPDARSKIENGGRRLLPAATVAKYKIGGWRREMVSVNESIAHPLEGLSPPPPPGPRIEIGDWRLEMEIGDLTESGLR